MAHDSRAVANEILRIAHIKGVEDMSVMKLIKLVYFAHEWMLGLTGNPLCIDAPEAWQYGPVFKNIFYNAEHNGSDPIAKPIKDKFGNNILDDYTDKEKEIIELVFDYYGDFSAFQLSKITHEKGSPWETTKNKYGAYWPISNNDIAKYSKKNLLKLAGVNQ